MSDAGVSNARRYCLLKSQATADDGEWGLSATWLGKQELRPGTALPLDFPLRVLLAAAHYTTAEDLEGADSAELRKRAGLNSSQAVAVFAALAAL